MKLLHKAVLLLALLLPVSASAQSMVATNGSTTVRLFLDACTPPVAALIQDEHLKNFFRASITYDGKEYKACWTAEPDENFVFIVTENKQAGNVPKAAFKIDEGV